MSSNGDAGPSRNGSQITTPALDVAFSTVADRPGPESTSPQGSRSGSRLDSESTGGRSTSRHRLSRRDRSVEVSQEPQRIIHKKHRHKGKRDKEDLTINDAKKSKHGFLLDSLRSSGHSNKSSNGSEKSNGKRKQYDPPLTPDKRRSAAYSRQSNDASSFGSSPLSREVRSDASWSEQTQVEQGRAGTPTMNPAQLVQMALSLSESRKRHVSNSLRIPIATNSPERRIVSDLQNHGTAWARPTGKQRSALYDRETQDRSSTGPRNSSAHSSYDQPDAFEEVPVMEGDNAVYTFSPATLSRAEKARRYFELASEHRRMLLFLPPLKPNSLPSGARKHQRHNTSETLQHSDSPDRIDSASTYNLGRQYNPIQALRNRRIRQRERRPLPVAADNWQDTKTVKTYVDSVETESASSAFYRASDHVALPHFPGDEGEQPQTSESSNGRPRRDTTGSVITRPENDWFVEPAELLADLYWTEKDENKFFIKDNHSQLIFPANQYYGEDKSRRSQDQTRKNQNVRGIVDDTSNLFASDNEGSGNDSRKNHRRHKLKLSIHGIDHVRKKRLGRIRAASDSSMSSVDSQQLQHLRHGGGFENTGPLEKHMAQIIAQDERGELPSPDLISPDHWDSRNTQFPVMRNRAESINKRASVASQHPEQHERHTSNDRLSPHKFGVGHRRARSADGRIHGFADGSPSVEDDNSAEPNSPMVQSFVPSFAMDISSPVKKTENKHISKLTRHFRNNSKERNQVDHMDFAEPYQVDRAKDTEAERGGGSRTPPRFSFDALRPLPIQRHKTSDSQSSSLRQVNTRESSSTVGRMFKNARLGGLKRTESRFRYKDKFGDIGSSADLANISDVERRSSEDEKKHTPGSASTDSDEMSPRHSFEGNDRPKFFNHNMPTFISASRGRGTDTPKSSTGSGASRQHSQRGHQKRPEKKGDRPRIVLPEGANQSQASLANSNADRHKNSYNSTARSSQVSLGELGSMDRFRHKEGSKIMPATGLRNVSASGQGPDSHRNWSLSHPALRSIDSRGDISKSSLIRNRDVVRCRALILASGIKAREIKRLSESPRSPDDSKSSDLQTALRTTGTKPPTEAIARKDESLTAAHILSQAIATTLQHFDHSLQTFHSTTSPAMLSEMQDLKYVASDKLTNMCHETSDDADAFTAQLATEFTMDVKNVEESVDAMFRRRNRRFRALRRVGFKGLEWTVLALMWAIWFTVVLFNAGKRLVMTIIAVIRWLFWF